MPITEKFELNETNLIEEIDHQIFNAHKIVLIHGQSLHFPSSSPVYFEPRVLMLSHEAYVSYTRETYRYHELGMHRGLMIAVSADRDDRTLWGWVL